MRCKNCGWDNAEGLMRCEKCNAPLTGSMAEGSSADGPTHKPMDSGAEILKGTVREPGSGGAYEGPRSVDDRCPNCGYPLSAYTKKCPNCGYAKNEESEEQIESTCCPGCGSRLPQGAKFCAECGRPVGAVGDPASRGGQAFRPGRFGTVNAWAGPGQGEVFCTLKPIAWEGEGVTYNPITYSGQSIVLNRSNTDPNNQSITSKEQAVLIHKDDGWYIEDHSSLQTTFVRAAHPIKLQTGDTLVLGNRLFEFKG